MAAIHDIPVVDQRHTREIIRLIKSNRPFLMSRTSFDLKPSAEKRLETVSEQLLRQFGADLQVPVVVCSSSSTYEDSGGTQGPLFKTLGGFLDYLAENRGECSETTYLKDWHVIRSYRTKFPKSAPLYFIPWGFDDDWLNGWFEAGGASDDYRFLYAGPCGSWTPMHHDILRSFSWSVNLCGRKRWILFRPEDTPALTVSGTLVSDVRPSLTPRASSNAKLDDASVASRAVVVEQLAGQVLFVPSGWHHQVENLEPTISVNHNWFNGFNLRHIVEFMLQENADMRAMLIDLRDDFIGDTDSDDDADGGGVAKPTDTEVKPTDERAWERHIEKLLRANGGMPLSELTSLLQNKAHTYEQRFSRFCAVTTSPKSRQAAAAADLCKKKVVPLPPALPCPGAVSDRLDAELPVEWGCSPEFFEWIDATESVLWIDDEIHEQGTEKGKQKPSSPTCLGNDDDEEEEEVEPPKPGLEYSSEGGGSSPAAPSRLDVQVAVHALLEISRALAKLCEPPHADHLFLPWRRRSPSRLATTPRPVQSAEPPTAAPAVDIASAVGAGAGATPGAGAGSGEAAAATPPPPPAAPAPAPGGGCGDGGARPPRASVGLLSPSDTVLEVTRTAVAALRLALTLRRRFLLQSAAPGE